MFIVSILLLQFYTEATLRFHFYLNFYFIYRWHKSYTHMLDYGVKNRNQTGLRKPNRIFKHWFFFVLACVWCSLVKKKCRARSWHSSSAFSDAHKSHDRSESCERAKWTLKGKEDRQKWKILWLTSMAMQLFSSVTAPEKNYPDVELGVNWVSWHLNEGRKKKIQTVLMDTKHIPQWNFYL